jgi:hypothetical protein
MTTAETTPVERFNCGSGGAQFCQGCYMMEPDNEHGEYVRWEDYERLQTAIEAIRNELAAGAPGRLINRVNIACVLADHAQRRALNRTGDV